MAIGERSALLVRQWRPMDTVPKDGTPVLLYSKKLGGVMLCAWKATNPELFSSPSEGWITPDGALACFEWEGWIPVPEGIRNLRVIPKALSDEDIKRLTE